MVLAAAGFLSANQKWLVLAAMVAHSLITNPHWQWDVVGQYLFSSRVVDGVVVTIVLTVLAMLIGVIGGIVIAVMRLSQNPIVSGIAIAALAARSASVDDTTGDAGCATP